MIWQKRMKAELCTPAPSAISATVDTAIRSWLAATKSAHCFSLFGKRSETSSSFASNSLIFVGTLIDDGAGESISGLSYGLLTIFMSHSSKIE